MIRILMRAAKLTSSSSLESTSEQRGSFAPLLDPKEGKTPKQPYAFEMANGKPFAFAGIWDGWKDGQGHWLQSFAIVTTEANELMSRIHPRMPVILHPRYEDTPAKPIFVGQE